MYNKILICIKINYLCTSAKGESDKIKAYAQEHGMTVKDLMLVALDSPSRLPEQPIFYPVLNEKYAQEIAERWNVKDTSDHKGYVTQFEVDDEYISQFEVQTVGRSYHQELWIPAEELDTFNQHIIGKIQIITTYSN